MFDLCHREEERKMYNNFTCRKDMASMISRSPIPLNEGSEKDRRTGQKKKKKFGRDHPKETEIRLMTAKHLS